MTEFRTFEAEDPFPSWFPNALQNFLTGAQLNFAVRVKPGDATKLQTPAGSADNVSAVAIDGRWRWRTSAVEVAGTGGAATLDVHVTAADDDFSTNPGPPPFEQDDTTRTFALALTAAGDTPPSVDLSRVVAKAVWDGAAFTSVTPVVGGEVDTRAAVVGDNTVTGPKIADNAITKAKVADDAIGAAEIDESDAPAIRAALRIAVEIGDYVWSARRTKQYHLLCDGSSQLRSSYSALFDAIVPELGTVTITIAAPGVLTLAGHGLQTGEKVILTSTGSTPTGVATNTEFYVIRVNANDFRLAGTRANARAGTAITTTGSQSGVHKVRACPHGIADATHFNVPLYTNRMMKGADPTDSTSITGHAPHAQGELGGEEKHALTGAENGPHVHDQWAASAFNAIWGSFNNSAGTFALNALVPPVTGSYNTLSSGSGTPHNNDPAHNTDNCFIFAGV